MVSARRPGMPIARFPPGFPRDRKDIPLRGGARSASSLPVKAHRPVADTRGMLRRETEQEVSWRVTPSGDPRVARLAQPGEECLEPVLGVIHWQLYLASLGDKRRRKTIRACERELMLSDRRLLVIDRRQRTLWDIPLAAITDVSLNEPQGNLRANGECVIRILWTVPDGRTKVIDFGTGLSQATSFAGRLWEAVGTVNLAAFRAEHGAIDLGDPRAAEVLALMHQAGEAELPSVLFMKDKESLPAPVASATRCPECRGSLRIMFAMACCAPCGLVWCDPGTEPSVDEAGRLIGTLPKGMPFFHRSLRELESVRCYKLTRDGAI